jgi:hypothetical protein
MLQGIKRWFKSGSADGKGVVGAFDGWSRLPQVQIRTPRDADGLIIDGACDDMPWRLEWGASQRPYVRGPELRIRADVALPADLQVIVLNRALQDAIEKTMFERYVEGVQTRLDAETPAEMRWVVMYPKLGRAELADLAERYAAVASATPWVRRWLDGPLRPALLGLKMAPTDALVLMIGRSRLTLRTGIEEADPAGFEPLLRLFEVALREAHRVGHQFD